MRVLLSTYGSRGDVEPMVGLAVRSRVLGAEVRGCAPPDFAELLARAAGAGRPAVAPGGARGDGGRSVIRKAAGIEFPGWDPSTSHLIAEVEMAEEPEWAYAATRSGSNP